MSKAFEDVLKTVDVPAERAKLSISLACVSTNSAHGSLSSSQAVVANRRLAIVMSM